MVFDSVNTMKPLMLKTTAVLAAAVIVLILFYRRTESGLLLSLAITAGTVLYHFAMRLVVGGIYNQCMKNRADYTRSNEKVTSGYTLKNALNGDFEGVWCIQTTCGLLKNMI